MERREGSVHGHVGVTPFKQGRVKDATPTMALDVRHCCGTDVHVTPSPLAAERTLSLN